MFSISKSSNHLFCHVKDIYNTFNINFYINLVFSSKNYSFYKYFKLICLIISSVVEKHSNICIFK